MCGICGKTEDFRGAAVSAMNAAMEHRGPDDEGIYVDRAAGVALGARRLSIIDVQGGHQPLSNEDGTVWAVLNGEIYNHPALQAGLRGSGHQLATGTDTEVLVHLYEDYGDDLVHALEGMFAFAIWDVARRRLLLGRDRFGEKPLFYAESGGEFSFASELSALRAGGHLQDELDPLALDDYFVFGYVPGARSIVKGVRQLLPGHLLTWEHPSRTIDSRSYWSPLRPPSDDTRGWIPVRRSLRRLSMQTARSTGSSTLADLAEETLSILESSIAGRMIADVPLGVLLSGGTDSTLIAALAQRSSGTPVKTFTVGYDVGTVSETGRARELAARLGTEHYEVTLGEADVAKRVPGLLARLDQPLADQALVAMHAVAEFARREVTVVVGGEGADELFAGYPRYAWLGRAGWMGRKLPRPATALVAKALRSAPIKKRAMLRAADVLDPSLSMPERHLDWVTAGRRHLRPALYGPLLREAAADGRILADLPVGGNGRPGDGVIADFMLLDQLHWLPGDVLAKADRASMLASLEVRTPYLHRELAEFAAAVPAETHAQGGGKVLLRMVLDGLVPGLGSRLRKTAFRVPSAQWLRGPLASALSGQLSSGALYDEGWIDRQAAGRLISEHQQGVRDWSAAIWPLLALGLWLDRFRGVNGN